MDVVDKNMSTTADFCCVLCKETFENKEDLQTHFRKHGDPKFNQAIKCSRSRISEDGSQGSGDTAIEEAQTEMVSCDVCTERFPTISKAITHKHKVHPNHDAKYFCPWCGKLFTMKHLYNKHIESTHDGTDPIEDPELHCDYCEVDFLLPSAMVYHNKFFHRQDTELAAIGYSRKMKKISNQEPLQVYYCPFCGEEYINKVNLHKHMGDDHSDEDQSPDDVLRCPLCDAIFYHLDAYELHLTFHTTDDLYGEENEMAHSVTEFSLETVPPIMEKVEPEGIENIEAIGIEALLQQGMNDLNDDNSNCETPEKKKKRKKHKKSKKAAITLDEFLNMNKDVFGEAVGNVQGIEEVPTQVVAKQLKVTKPRKNFSGPKKHTSAEIEKLKKHGIVVKQKFNNLQGAKIVKRPINVQNFKASQNPSKSSPTDVLAKLQNSQLSIVKKSTLNTSIESPNNKTSLESKPDDRKDMQEVNNGNESKNLSVLSSGHKNTEQNSSKATENSSNKTEIATNKEENSPNVKENSERRFELVEERNLLDKDKSEINSTDAVDALKNLSQHITVKSSGPINALLEENSNSKKIYENSQNDARLQEVKTTSDALKNLSQHITVKSLSVTNRATDKLNSNKINNSQKDEVSQGVNNTPENMETNSKSSSKSFNTIKHLSQLIVKSCTQPGPTSPVAAPKNIPDEENNLDLDTYPENSDNIDISKTNKTVSTREDGSTQSSPKPLDALKNLSKDFVIKSLKQSPKPERKNDERHSLTDKVEHRGESEEQLKTLKSNIGFASKKEHIVQKQDSPKSLNTLKNISKNITIKSLKQSIEPAKANAETAYDSDDMKHSDDNEDHGASLNDGDIPPNHKTQKIKLPSSITMKTLNNTVVKGDASSTDEDIASYNEPQKVSLPSSTMKSSKNCVVKDGVSSNDEDIPVSNKNQMIKLPSCITMKTLTKNSVIKEQLPKDSETSKKVDHKLKKIEQNLEKIPLTARQSYTNVQQLPDTSVKSLNPTVTKGLTIKTSRQVVHNDNIISKSHIDEKKDEIEIFNIDDSDDEEIKNHVTSKVETKSSFNSLHNSPNPRVDIIKNLGKNITIKSSSQPKPESSKAELFNHDDSDSEEIKKHVTSKIESKSSSHTLQNSPNPKLDIIKNLGKNITINSSSHKKSECSKPELFNHDGFEENEHSDDEKQTNVSPAKKNSFLDNKLKNLSKNITVKTSPKMFSKNVEKEPHDEYDSEPETRSRVKITEIEEAEQDDNENNVDDQTNKNVTVQSPDSDSDMEDNNDEDFESHLKSSKLVIGSQESGKPHGYNNYKDITLKSFRDISFDDDDDDDDDQPPQKIPNIPLRKSSGLRLGNEVTSNSVKKQQSAQKMTQTTHHQAAGSKQVNTVNKQVTVQRLQTETVIEEITTTVTKTVRTVNQSVNQAVRNYNQNTSFVRPQKVQHYRPNQQIKNVQSAHTIPTMRPRIRNPNQVNPTRGCATVSNQLVPFRPVGASNQLVPIRPGAIIRGNSPRMPPLRKPNPTQNPMVGKTLKISPNALTSSKRPVPEEPGPFSCFKKPNNSAMPSFDSEGTVVTSAQMSKSNFSSTTKTVKGNTVVTATQSSSEASVSTHQIKKLSGVAGLKVSKTSQAKTVAIEEKSEVSNSKRSALEAIERLQKQGLLVKKPRIEEENNDHSNSGEEYYSDS